ncbi:MAG: hypothetical protein WCL53_07975 [Chloroflexota bacterium]
MAFSAIRLISNLPAQGIAAAVTAIVTAALAAFATLYRSRSEQRERMLREQREHQIAVYDEFLTFLFRVTSSSAGLEPELTAADMQKYFIEFTRKTLLYGSDCLVRAYIEFRDEAQRGGGSDGLNYRLTIALEHIMIEIRGDIGHSKGKLKPGDLLSMYINDIESIRPHLITADREIRSSSKARWK